MKNKWIKLVEEINEKEHKIPEGWSTTNQIAIELKCQPEDVAVALKTGVTCGYIDKRAFKHYDSTTKKVELVTCYKIKNEECRKEESSLNKKTERIIELIESMPNSSDYAISRRLYRCTAEEVRIIRQQLNKK